MENFKLQEIATNVRKDIVRMIHNAKSGHPGGSLSIADIMTVLYFEEMNITTDNLNDVNRDKFVLSKGHASPAIYGVLKAKGFLTDEDVMSFRLINSNIQGHPSKKNTAGVDMSTGSLGQGISAAVGIALSNKLRGNEFRTYSILGDGECQEGQVWEALMAASHYNLDNLCVFLDYNGLQIDGNITNVMNPEPFKAKFEAFGLNVLNINGHDYDEIKNALKQARETKGKPTMIIAHTVKGKGVSFMENNYGWHGQAPSDENLAQALSDLEVK